MIKNFIQNDFEEEIVNQLLEISNNKFIVFAFPTGNTPIVLYNKLSNSSLNWSKIKIFMLDSLYPQKINNPFSYSVFIHKHFLSKIKIPEKNFHILNSETKNPYEECKTYEKLINKSGGLDLAILGIGQNGHIAFNEPGSPFDSVTRKVKITDETRIANGGIKNTPEFGLTVGIKTIMNAKKIFLMAKGKNKADIVKKAIQGPITSAFPASILQTHPDCTFFLDNDAASLLSNQLTN